jgi:hypothetical protein
MAKAAKAKAKKAKPKKPVPKPRVIHWIDGSKMMVGFDETGGVTGVFKKSPPDPINHPGQDMVDDAEHLNYVPGPIDLLNHGLALDHPGEPTCKGCIYYIVGGQCWKVCT